MTSPEATSDQIAVCPEPGLRVVENAIHRDHLAELETRCEVGADGQGDRVSWKVMVDQRSGEPTIPGSR
jgi:hypothetical protein